MGGEAIVQSTQAIDHASTEDTPMLAEKFFLLLETLIKSRTYPDGSPRVVSTSPHIPVELPRAK
jgi:hypothetical protein